MGRRKKKKFDKLGKAGIITFISGALVVNWFKRNIIGRTPIRKAMFYTTVGALFLYNSCGDEIGKNLTVAYNKADELINNPIQEENEYLNTQIQELKDSLIELNKSPEQISKEYVANNKPVQKSTNTPTSRTTWYVVKKGDSLSEIARKYYGSTSSYLMLADINKIKNPEIIEAGFPLKLNPNNLRTDSGVRNDNLPTHTVTILKGETINDVLEKYETSNIDAKTVLDYNRNKGNIIPPNGFKDIEKAILYLPEVER